MTSFRIALVIAAAVVAVPAAQWLNHPTTGIPRRDTVIELQPAHVNRQGQAIAGWKQP